MKVAILSESDVDEMALRPLIGSVLGVEAPSVPEIPAPRHRGWPAVMPVLPGLIKRIFFHTDADGMVVVVDSDESIIHNDSHDPAIEKDRGCRACKLLHCCETTIAEIQPKRTARRLNIAVGLAVPAIEAWLACGEIKHLNEATWARKLSGVEKITYDKISLKKEVYGDLRLPHHELTKKAGELGEKMSKNIACLETYFTAGYGLLKKQLFSWPH